MGNSLTHPSIKSLDETAPKFINYIGERVQYEGNEEQLKEIETILYCAKEYIPEQHFDYFKPEHVIKSTKCQEYWSLSKVQTMKVLYRHTSTLNENSSGWKFNNKLEKTMSISTLTETQIYLGNQFDKLKERSIEDYRIGKKK